MTSQPISSNQPISSGNAANVLPAGSASDSLTSACLPAEPFAFLLAQQIGKNDSSIPDAAQTDAIDGTAADGGADRPKAQDQAAANPPPDPANALAAIMLQLPAQEEGGQKTGDQPSLASPPFQKTGSRQMASSQIQASSRKAGDEPTASPFALDSSRKTAPQGTMTKPEEMIHVPVDGHLTAEAIKRQGTPSGLPQPAHGPVVQSLLASPAIPAAMPSMPANATPAAPSLAMTTPFGNSGWADEFSQKISWISTQQNQVAELRLNPPNLGPLDVVLRISDNQATALFASPHGAVRDAVENALPKLREILADNGIMLGNATISDQPPRDRGTDGFMNRGFGTATPQEALGIAPEPAGLPPAAVQPIAGRRHNGMVDTFA